MPTGDRWGEVSRLYHDALEVPAAERLEFLRSRCADETLRREVESLLRWHEHAAPFPVRPSRLPVTASLAETRTSGDDLRPSGNGRAALQVGPLDGARFVAGHVFAARYRIVNLLGRGGMSEVYRADDLRVGQVVALKLMAPAIARRPDGLQRLTAEVRLARTIAHPNVCRVFDIGHAEGWHYLTMEYVDGETLASLLRRIGQLPVAKALALGRQLCVAVAAAHERGVLHRDLKPANIMVDGSGQLRVMDFGLAVAASSDVCEIAGTHGYMAPEQLVGGPVSPQTDLYALGRVLLQILPAGLDPEVATVLQACVSPDPRRRPPSANAIADVLTAGYPQIVADAGASTAPAGARSATEALGYARGWLLLAAAVGGTVAVAAYAHMFNVAPSQVPKPPEVLAERARDVLIAQGHTTAAVDRAFWWSAAEGDDRIRFTYRESPAHMIPANLFRVITSDDPPSNAERLVTLEADGSITSERAAPRAVWGTGRSSIGEMVLWFGIVNGFVAGAILAHRNLRAGEGDLRGARRLAVFVCCGGVLLAALRAHHTPSPIEELAWLLSVTGWSIVWAAFSWLAYITFEPYVRRWWPHAVVSWRRLLAGKVREPMVGREVLLGTAAGVALAALQLTHFQALGHSAPLYFRQPALEALGSTSRFAGALVLIVLDSLQFTLAGIAGLVLLRLLLRRTWAAVVVFAAIAAPMGPTFSSSVYDGAVAVAFVLCALGVLLKWGVLANLLMMMVVRLLAWLPLTLDTDAWYFGQSLVVLLVIVGTATYGFLVGLGDRPVFGGIESRRPQALRT